MPHLYKQERKQAVKANPSYSWQGHSGRVRTDVGGESAESRSVLQPFPHYIGDPPRAPLICYSRRLNRLFY